MGSFKRSVPFSSPFPSPLRIHLSNAHLTSSETSAPSVKYSSMSIHALSDTSSLAFSASVCRNQPRVAVSGGAGGVAAASGACAAPAAAGSSKANASMIANTLLFMFIPPIPLSNAAPLCLRRIAEILYPYFVALSCNTSSIAAKARRIRMQNILANRSCQMMRYCP